MNRKETTSISLLAAPVALAVAVVVCGPDTRWHEPVVTPESSSYIIQAESVETAKALTKGVGGAITHELGILRAVGAELSAAQLAALEDLEGIVRIDLDDSHRHR